MIMACNGLQDCSKVQVTEFPFHKTGKILGKVKLFLGEAIKKLPKALFLILDHLFHSLFTGTFTTQCVSFSSVCQ